MPVLSVITINYNKAEELEKTLQSVFSQNFSDYEYIVIDGGSTDGSVDVIKKYADKITYWVSEKDDGIYNAQNKGIKAAKGTYCLFLNAGDYMYDDKVFETVFKSGAQADIIYGNMIIDYGNGKQVLGKMPEKISFYQMFTDTLWHPVSFIKRALFEKYGYYNEGYKIVADYDFFFKTIIVNNVTTHHIAIPISVYDTTGLSSAPENKPIERAERRAVQSSYLPVSVIELMDELVEQNRLEKNKLLNRIINKLRHVRH